MNNDKKLRTEHTLMDISTYQAGIAQSTAHRLLKHFTEECVSDYGITMMQWFMIGTIYDAGSNGIGISELSRRLDTNVPYITNTLNVLEVKGIIARRRRSEDSRAKVVTISQAFLPSIPIIEQDLRQKMRTELYPGITPEELHAYVNVLHKISSTLDRYDKNNN